MSDTCGARRAVSGPGLIWLRLRLTRWQRACSTLAAGRCSGGTRRNLRRKKSASWCWASSGRRSEPSSCCRRVPYFVLFEHGTDNRVRCLFPDDCSHSTSQYLIVSLSIMYHPPRFYAIARLTLWLRHLPHASPPTRSQRLGLKADGRQQRMKTHLPEPTHPDGVEPVELLQAPIQSLYCRPPVVDQRPL